jgi:HK97 gp10 family phage protein
MPIKGRSFSVDTNAIDRVLGKVKSAQATIDKSMLKRVTMATTIVFKTATAKRPMMTKKQMKELGRSDRVSDPNAQLGVPVRTGALQISIKQEVTQKKGITRGRVWTNSPYAKYIEFGTSKMAARPFMSPALNLNTAKIRQLLRGEKDQ